MATPSNDPSELHVVSGFITSLREQDRLLTEAMNAKQREISVPHVGFIKRIFDKVSDYDPILVATFVPHADPATSLAQIRDAIAKLNARVHVLKTENIKRLKKKQANLTSLLSQFQQQDEILKGVIPRSASWEGASDSIMAVLADLFRRSIEALPEKGISFNEKQNNLEGLRGQIIAVQAKISDALLEIQSRMDEHSLGADPRTNSTSPERSANPRRVFVIHGRNLAARDALFSFLRSIDLSPIEWEEAVAMTGIATPYVGEILDTAFTESQAAIVLLTGDDLARLGTRYQTETDEVYERQFTPQARPNVLFEAGMAFGRQPKRTIIVSIGQTRPFSDTFGRHIIHLSNSAQSRLRMIGRLKTAECDLHSEGREDWLSAGDFESANLHPDTTSEQHAAHPETAARPAAKIPNADRYYPQLSDEVKEAVATSQERKSLLADGSDEYTIASPDDFIVRIVREENNSTKGLILSFTNGRLSSIGKTRLIIRSAQSFDSRKNGYRDGRTFRAFDHTDPDPIHAGCNGKGIWFVHKRASNQHLFAGNDDQHPLCWPDNDKSSVQRWLIIFEVLAFELPARQSDPGVSLQSVKQTICLIWNPSTNEFFIEKAPEEH